MAEPHLVYTHGYAAVASLVNTADAPGAPKFLLQDIPPVGSSIPLRPRRPTTTAPRSTSASVHDVPYVVVDTKQPG